MTELPAALRLALADRYRLERELGQGGMARVYLATDLKHRRPVAIKILKPAVTALIGVDRFVREIRVMATFQHPHILPLFDSGEVNGEPYYVMPFVAGETLRELLRRGGRLGVAEALRITGEVASALEFAHRRGIVHRDIKPANILLSDGHALVADFGIARALTADAVTAERLTSTGMALGTPGYMSPEQVAGEPNLDARTDVYALGAVTYEMLAGQPPYAGPSATAVLAQALTAAPQPLSEVRRGIAPTISAAVQRALATERSDRFATAAGFAEALEVGGQAGAGREPVLARRRSWLIAGALLAVMLIGAWLIRATGAREAAKVEGVRIAVIPFREAGDTSNAGFLIGLTTALRTDLGTLPGVDVIAGTSIDALGDSVRAPRYLRQQLGATHLLSGTVQWRRADDGTVRVLVTPEVVDLRPAKEISIRGAVIEDRVDELFRTQARVSADIARALGIPLSAEAMTRLAKPPTRNPAAYRAFLESQVDPVNARDYLERAVALDSTFGPAWIGLALQAQHAYGVTFRTSMAELAQRASIHALRVDSASSWAHVAALMVARNVDRDFAAAVGHADRAIQLAPGDPDILTLAASAYFVARRFDDALRVSRRAAELDPRNSSALARVENLLQWNRDLIGAEEYAGRALAIDRYQSGFITIDSLWLPLMRGHAEAAETFARSLPTESARASLAVIADRDWLLGWALDTGTARLGQERFQREGDLPYYYLALTRTAWQRRDRRAAERFAGLAAAEIAPRIGSAAGGSKLRMVLGYVLALGGRCAEGLAQSDTAHAGMSAWQDGFFGAGASLTRAEILAVCGQGDHSLALIDSLLKVPGLVTPEWLAIDPHFAGLRTDARFRALAKLGQPAAP